MQKCSRVNKLIIIALCLTGLNLFSQTKTDNELMFGRELRVSAFEGKRQVSYLFAGKNAFIKYNPVSLVFGGLLFVYQKTISVQIGANCPYEINCSNFSRLCIRKYGILKGIPLTADRLTRCTKLASLDMTVGVDFNARSQKIYDHPDEYKFKSK